ncbi:MAG TPA: cytochrome P450, partial [Minicystis sp.]|nr:cytochrome P450 [Minicystis sp.]
MNDVHDLPKVPGHPLLGSLLDVRRDRVGFLSTVNARHGDVVRMRHGVFPVVVSADAAFSHEVLVDQADAFQKGFGLSVFMRPMLGNGLLTSEGAFHKRQRRMMAPAFAHKRIAEYASAITERACRAASHWRDGERIDFAEEMMKLTLEIVGKTLFDAEVGSDAAAVGEAITGVMKAAIDNINAVVPVPPSWPTPRNLRAKRHVAELDAVIYRLIRERRRDGRDHGDFLSMLLAAQDEDDKSVMTDEQVRDEAMTIFLAGHETTANALAWTLYLLAQHPDVRERVEREVDAALGGSPPTLADVGNLPLSLAVLKEAMRLYPPAYLVTRRATRAVTIAGRELPAGQLVLVNILGMHRSGRYFAEPLRFDPGRFLPGGETHDKLAYLPFGAGPRVCIGNHFALMEGQLAVAAVVQRARLDLPAGSARVDAEPLVT